MSWRGRIARLWSRGEDGARGEPTAGPAGVEPAEGLAEGRSAADGSGEPHVGLRAARPADREALLRQLEEEAAAHLPALPILATQLRQTARQVEEAVVEACGGFGGIVSNAQESVARASKLLEAEEHNDHGGVASSMDGLIRLSRNTMEALLQRILRASELSMRAVYRMDDVEAGMQHITKVLEGVNDIAVETRMLAINAKIEAVRVGEAGKGFAVVADGISQLARRCGDTADSIRGIVKSLVEDVEGAVSELRGLAAEDMNEMLSSKNDVDVALRGFSQTHEAMQESLREATERGRALASEVARAVVALQFQDRVNQRLEHVETALEEMAAALTPALEGLDSASRERIAARRAEVLDRLGERTTMREEREHGADPDGDVAGIRDDGDVELF